MLKPISIGRATGNGPNYGMNGLIDKDGQPKWELLESLDWIQEMQACPQDPIWHAEGDVYKHTQMVTSAVMGLPEFQGFTEQEQYTLFLSAVLHDIAKPICTETSEDGRIIAPRHAKVGEKLARQLLWNADFWVREQICSLVRLHGLPLWSLDKGNPNASVISSSLRLRNDMLYALCKADVLGRICTDQAELLERAEFFKEFCLESNCYEQSFDFYNEHSKFRYFLKGEEHPAQLYDNTEFEVVILSGIAGSGKDTYAAKLDLPMVSLDEIREELGVKHGDKKGLGHVVQLAYERAKKYCINKESFVWNSTNLTSDMRARLINALSVYDPRFKMVYLETSVANVFSRRSSEIPKKQLQAMFRILEMPQPYEAHCVEYWRDGELCAEG